MGTNWTTRIDGKEYKPQTVSAMILTQIKKDAEEFIGEPVTEAVITVPAYFNDIQRQATKDAGRIAGLEVKRIINEPTSAALSYGLDHGEAQKVMVYDLGGGTFDVSIIEIGDGVIEVLSTAGDNHLGGDDFDARVTNWIVGKIREEHKVDVTKAKASVKQAAKDVKEVAEVVVDKVVDEVKEAVADAKEEVVQKAKKAAAKKEIKQLKELLEYCKDNKEKTLETNIGLNTREKNTKRNNFV